MHPFVLSLSKDERMLIAKYLIDTAIKQAL